MGQARRRGTFETRLAQALARNECLRGHITDKPILKNYAKTHGMQALSTRLLQNGLLAVNIHPKPPCEPQKSPSF
jgi:hypothetical protein